MIRDLSSISQAKQAARQLRAALAEQGEAISHAQALERVVQQHGFRDWNAFHAKMRDRPSQGWTAGGRVTGHYLSQPFAATVLTAARVVDYYNNERHHGSLGNLTPADVSFGRDQQILKQREEIKRKTTLKRRLRHQAEKA